jgi:membrane-associated protein
MISITLLAVSLLDPEAILRRGGLAILLLIVFAESGLFFGFFLPGDSLLFVAGFLSSPDGLALLPPPQVLIPLLFVAAVAGDQVGYVFGLKAGPALFSRPRSRLFNPEHLVRAQHFYERYGAKTIVLARFVPIVRTFAPIVAGAGSMTYRTFVVFNVLGGLVWTASVTLLGYFFGGLPIVRDNIEITLLGIVGLSIVPIVIEMWRARQRARAAS